MDKIYFDYNSSTPLDKRVFKKMLPYLGANFANPSAIYSIAQKAKNAIEDARISVANLLGAKPKEIIFTSGGTEANNLAIKGFCFANRAKGNHIITSKIEHSSVLNVFNFLETKNFKVTYLDVDEYGIINMEQLESCMDKETILLSIMHVNNEIGTIQPIEKLKAICNKRKVCFHTDAVQSFGKVEVDVAFADLITVSSHKIYGPKGAGALYVGSGISIEPLLHGGHQEEELRPGTEAVASIVGFGEACRLRLQEMKAEQIKVKKMRDALEAGILKTVKGIKVNGHPQNRLYNTLNICIEGVEAQNLVINLDMRGFCASSGSACQARVPEVSYVLIATGMSQKDCAGALRLSLGKFNKESDIHALLKVLPEIIKNLRASASHG
ncbi:MAG: cysteine desulfurase [Candidatus Omnitrophica bacterium]|jgi:cysteine desulfurase|nr:cysteine desulfurase [Candidatus Omnitrophota bacterium]